jgi:hypothetical protein
VSRAASGPVVIGGVGGSGTRVVAEIVRGVGVYLGDDLNDSCDNLWATLLLRRPSWYAENRSNGAAGIHHALHVLEGAMNGRLDVDADVGSLLSAADRDLRGQGLSDAWTRSRIESLLEHGRSGMRRPPWGWKEPNSHVYVDFIGGHFADARYVHVIRHGLDMAFSANQWQVRTWGWLFGITAAAVDVVDPATSLDYWIMANRRAIDTAKQLFGPKFLLVNYDELCADSVRGAQRIATFVDGELSPSQAAVIREQVGSRQTAGRWRRSGALPFRREQLEKVAALGFDVE